MSTLQARLETAKTEAMKAKLKAADKTAITIRLQAIRSLLTAIAKAETSGKDRVELTDENVIAVLRKEYKQRQESAAVYSQAGQTERAEQELAEAEVINEFLPQLLDEAATEELVKATIAELGVTDMKGMGRVMGAFKARTDLDRGLVNQIVRRILA